MNKLGQITVRKVMLGICLSLFVSQVSAQLVERPAMTKRGNYDIKMISAPVLQPVWVKTLNPLQIDRPLTEEEMRSCGRYLSLNNDVSAMPLEGGNSVKITANMQSKAQPYVPVGDIGISTVYADCDNDMATYQSSAAYLDFGADMACASIQSAYLYWCGNNTTDITTYAPYPGIPTMRSHMGGATGTVTGYNTVQFKAPGDISYSSITADRTLNTLGTYVCFADVTSKVVSKPAGLYWVANVKNNGYDDGGGSKGGWTLVVIYKSANCPNRVIKFWDGYLDAAGGANVSLSFGPGEVPATGNSNSYLGFTTVDAETDAGFLVDNAIVATPENSGVQFISSPGGTLKYINPLVTEQDGINVFDNNGVYYTNVKDGMASSRITTWDAEKQTSGNEIIRIPSNRNTLGYGSHHIKLPAGSIVPATASANMVLPIDHQGNYAVYLAYMAIEAIQPKLILNLRAEESSTAPNGIINYVLSVSNISPLSSQSGAYIFDTLENTLDFIPGTVEYLRGTAPTPFEIQNQGADLNEALKFYLPAIAAGNGTTAFDSVVIRFKARVKPLTRTDIWTYSCHRVIRNRAKAYYLGDSGQYFEEYSNSNSFSTCVKDPVYHQLPIVDPVLDAQYAASHFITDSIYDLLRTASKTGTVIKVDSLARQYLIEKLTILGIPTSNAALYQIYLEDGTPLSPSAVFDLSQRVKRLVAELDMGQGCIEVFNFEFTLEPTLLFDISKTGPSVIGLSDGSITVDVKQGKPRYSCAVYDALANCIYQANAATADSIESFVIEGLAAGVYQVVVGDQGMGTITKSVSLLDPLPLSVSVTAPASMCNGMAATLTAVPVGRDGSVSLEYVWYQSYDNSTWTVLAEMSNELTATITQDTYFKVYVCDNANVANTQVLVQVDMTVGCVPTSFELVNKDATLIYPNPTKEGFYIKTAIASNLVKIYSLNGKLLFNEQVNDNSYINIATYTQGTYIVDVNGVQVKLIKQ